MKVKGFQVAPAELEGCILEHPDVSDTCVVPISDSYSGELPMAFVVLHPNAVKRVALDPAEGKRVKVSIIKVGSYLIIACNRPDCCPFKACSRQQGRI
jgi:acyl-CoA synthetase (AMP-forming)/AMP-acid ligase II